MQIVVSKERATALIILTLIICQTLLYLFSAFYAGELRLSSTKFSCGTWWADDNFRGLASCAKYLDSKSQSQVDFVAINPQAEDVLFTANLLWLLVYIFNVIGLLLTIIPKTKNLSHFVLGLITTITAIFALDNSFQATELCSDNDSVIGANLDITFGLIVFVIIVIISSLIGVDYRIFW